ncbi:hypothetical protein CQW23_31941 [Capsicum baccatum]|uniref:Integrase catalytic domain-containing protein n=1 Tax=Capsicum baccatum TaxID=33114 RepID=A0A2G2V671_CAPBA|nr:hypothetical protein CQW23_31941 [Capsicum baccatum]
MDVIGPIEPKESNGHRFILVDIDYFTKWVETVTFKSMTKKVVVDFVHANIICRFGIPKMIITDNAANLNSHLLQEVCQQFKFAHQNSTPHRPKANGVVEAANKNIKKILQKMVQGSRQRHEELSFIARLSHYCTLTGATPYLLVYGTEAVIPVEVEIPSLRVIAEAEIDDDEWVEAKGKFSPNWQGPFVVKQVLPNGALYLTDIEGKMAEMAINADAPGNAPRSSVLFDRGMPRRIMLAENDRDEGLRNQADDTKEDYLSQLPDDVLCSILGKLTLREAARTTILCTRWKYLFASTQLQQQPPFLFRCLEMFGIDHNIHDRCPYYQEKDKFMNALFQFSRLYSDLRVAEVKLVCCFVREFPSAFTHWFRSISRVGVERLFLSFECPGLVPICDSSKLLKFSLENLSQASSLEHLFLSHCVVLPSPQVRFSSLTTLALRAVVLKCRHLECILSSCSNLEKLTIEYSKLPYKLRLAGTVKQVVIWRCDGGKEIDLHAEYLHTLECMVWNNVRFFFSFVPMLENVTVCPWWSNSYIFSRGARDLDDQVKFLTLGVFADEVNYSPVEIPTEIETFRSLRTLSLTLISNYEILHLVEPSELLDACPLLQNFNLVVVIKKSRRINDVRGRRRPRISPWYHDKLKQVTFGGFYGTESEMRLVLYVLTTATVLEKMFLSPGYENYFSSAPQTKLNLSFDEGKRNSIQQKLHGRAISRKAVVIIL